MTVTWFKLNSRSITVCLNAFFAASVNIEVAVTLTSIWEVLNEAYIKVGCAVGTEEGSADGILVGTQLGIKVGIELGLTDGSLVGKEVGISVGCCDGEHDGI